MRKVHLVGIAGSGLAGLARLLSMRGLEVSGSELLDSTTLEGLRGEGIRCSVGQSESGVPEGVDLVVISAAVGEHNPEVVSARRRRITVLKYAQCLGRLMAEKKGIAVAGTHGKTTTTAMVAWSLARAAREPSFLIGGEHAALGGSSRWGAGEHFVAEACEFDRSFLNLRPTFAIVTNIEEDHLDYFRSLEEIREAFAEFVGWLPAEGWLVLNADDPSSGHLPGRCRAGVERFSLAAGEGDWWAEEVRQGAAGVEFTARSRGGEGARLALRVPGLHNVKNALAATALLRRAGLRLEEVRAGLETFTGVRRRFEVLREEPAVVIDDYAHHPTEIEAVLRATRERFPGKRVRLVFQPHQHSRTRCFLQGFARALAGADEAVVAEVFRARDPDEELRLVHSGLLVDEVRRLRGNAVVGPSFEAILEHLLRTLEEGEVLVFLGAGDITLLARRAADLLGRSRRGGELWPGAGTGAAGRGKERVA